MARPVTLYDAYGRPIDRSALRREIATPTLGSVRRVTTGYPGDGLTPPGLAAALRAADAGDATRYLELAETVEERDLHYAGVLGTRKRSVAQLAITVEAASDDPEHERHAETIRAWLDRDSLQDELFDLLDAVGKGYAVTEILWDTSAGSWMPLRLESRDPRWFRFDRSSGQVLHLRTEDGVGQDGMPLPPFKFITATIKAKSGLPIRSGVARLALWAWLFKSYAQRDWAIFCQNYGQPIRVGKYSNGATEAERDILYQAVVNIAGDCAAIIPQGMELEFVELKSVATSADLYERRCDWLDRQVSKAVLGQTATTDAIAGGHAVGREHRQVQEDIERADARALAAVLNRDLVRPWIDLEFGPQDAYPRLRIGREEQQDVALTVDAVTKLVPLGLKVGAGAMRALVGLPEPQEGEDLLTAPAAAATPGVPSDPAAPGAGGAFDAARRAALQAPEPAPPADAVDRSIDAILADGGWSLVEPLVDGLADRIAEAGSVEEATAAIAAQIAAMDVDRLAEILARAAFRARLAGEADEPLA